MFVCTCVREYVHGCVRAFKCYCERTCVRVCARMFVFTCVGANVRECIRLRSLQVLRRARSPPAVESSANQTRLFTLSSRRWMSGVTVIAYIAMARGSPWVVLVRGLLEECLQLQLH